MQFRLGFTGTRNGMTSFQATAFKLFISGYGNFITEFHHGDCLGADLQAHRIVKSMSSSIIHIHPPVSNASRAHCSGHVSFQPLPYLDRDRDIVDSTDVLVATPAGTEIRRSGTWFTVRCARSSNLPVMIIYPDGRVEYERWTL